MNIVADISAPNKTPQKAQVDPEPYASHKQPIDKRAAARDAKKKQRRRAHRVVLRRSHSDG
jgi:hypothetical protein